MKKISLFENHAKSGEDCDKFSKSVSYETLVGGTTTAGRDYKQTQSLSKGSAKTPLTAVGTLTSQLCCSAKVVEKSLYRHSEPQAKNPEKHTFKDWILHFASAQFRMTTGRGSLKKIATSEPVALPRNDAPLLATSAFRLLAMTPITLSLAAVLAMGMLSESWAAVINKYDDNGRLVETITGNGKYTYNYDETTGKLAKKVYYMLRDNKEYEKTDGYVYSYEDNENVVTFHEGYCNYLGCGLSPSLLDVYRTVYDEHGNETAYQHCPGSGSTSCVINGLNGGLYYTTNEYYESDNELLNGKIKSSSKALGYALQGSYGSINNTEYEYDEKTGYLKAKNSEACVKGSGGSVTCTPYSTTTYQYDDYGNMVQEYIDGVLSTENRYSDAYYDNKCSETKNCEICKSNGRVTWQGVCYEELPFSKKHWTPAEAAQWLKDTDNTIIMTFKVNR